MTLLARALGIQKAPCPQTIIHWVSRRTIVRLDAARTLRGLPLDRAPLSTRRMWMIDISLGLGSGKMLAVLAFDAPHHQRESKAPTLRQGHCIGVAVATSWNGETIADFLTQRIATMARPAAALQDNGSDRHKAVAFLDAPSLGSPCLDDISHAAASMRKRTSQHHPACERFRSAGGRGAGKRKHTLLACLAPPTVRTKARFRPVHRLCTWADRVLQLSPPGGAKRGSMCAKLRAALDDLPTCKALIQRLRHDARARLACHQLRKTQGLSPDTLAQCAPRIDGIPTTAIRREFAASRGHQLATATTLGLDHVGLPISAAAIASLVGVAKHHGVGETQDAARIALRLPAFCGVPTREDAAQGLEISVARQREFTAGCPSLTTQRRAVLSHPERLESLGLEQGSAHVALISSPKNRPNNETNINISLAHENSYGPQRSSPAEPLVIENTGPPDIEKTALAS